MDRRAWDALRVGDRVLLHHKNGDQFPLEAGVVAFVDGQRGGNMIGVRLSDPGYHGRVVRPTRMTVHPDPIVDDTDCWRCGRSVPEITA